MFCVDIYIIPVTAYYSVRQTWRIESSSHQTDHVLITLMMSGSSTHVQLVNAVVQFGNSCHEYLVSWPFFVSKINKKSNVSQDKLLNLEKSHESSRAIDTSTTTSVYVYHFLSWVKWDEYNPQLYEERPVSSENAFLFPPRNFFSEFLFIRIIPQTVCDLIQKNSEALSRVELLLVLLENPRMQIYSSDFFLNCRNYLSGFDDGKWLVACLSS